MQEKPSLSELPRPALGMQFAILRNMAWLILQFLLLAAVIVAAGTVLASAADRIGALTGLGATLAGFLLLAAATSLPELVIDCNAAKLEAANLAVGDLLGSSIFNLLILGIVDLSHRRAVRILSSVSAAHALSAITSIVLTAIVLMFIVLPYHYELFGIGGGSWLIVVTYMLSIRLIYLDQRLALRQAQAEAPEAIQAPEPVGMSLNRSVTRFGLAALTILLCGPLLARTADQLADESGLGGTIVGTIFVAVTTSLPEIITTITAVRMGAFELAAGNIFGSNCFNIAILPIVDFFYSPGPILQAIDISHVVTATAVIIITGIAIMGLLYRVEKRYWLFEPDALLVVLLCLCSLTAIVLLGGV